MPDQSSSNQPSTGPVPVTLGGSQPVAPGQDNAFGASAATLGGGTPPLISRAPLDGGGGRSPMMGIVLSVVGLLFLVGAVTAGVLLVQQNQDINEGASVADKFCGGVSGINECNANDWCWIATTTNQCLVNGVPEGSAEYFAGNGTFDGQVCYDCKSGGGVTVDPGQGTICSPGTKIGGNDAKCPAGGGDPNPPQPPDPTPPPGAVCGETCTVDSDCRAPTNTQVTAVCRAGKCVNKACHDKGGATVFGTLCACDKPTGKCGEECGAAIGLCDASLGVTCTYLARSQCTNVSHPICVPIGTGANNRGPLKDVPLYQGAAFERTQCGSGTADPSGNFISHPAFATGLTPEQVNQFICNPQTETPSGQCLNVKIYDTNWVEITSAGRSALKPGDVIRLTVAGSSTSGAIDQARFTFNGTLRAPVTAKRPGTQEFFDEITIPAGATAISIKGEVHHPTLNWF